MAEAGMHDSSPECREMFARLSEYLDGELPENLCEEMKRHLADCTPCEAFVRTLKLTVDLCHGLPAKHLPDDVRAELRALLHRDPAR